MFTQSLEEQRCLKLKIPTMQQVSLGKLFFLPSFSRGFIEGSAKVLLVEEKRIQDIMKPAIVRMNLIKL